MVVTCSEKNDHVIVEVEDDGKGINTEAIRAKLRANQSHTEAQIAAMPDGEVHAMIFEAGFSTAQQVTDISGRGVGMSMVKSLIQDAGGSISIQSRDGLGTKFTFSIPVPKSVLITNCLFVRTGDDQFGIVQDDIVRSLQVSPEQRSTRLSPVEGGLCLNVDGEILPVVDLADGLGAPGTSSLRRPDQDLHFVVTNSPATGRRAALCVDEILDIEDTVIKSLASQFNPFGLYRGVTFMDDGTVGLILDMNNFIERAGGSARHVPAPKTAVAAEMPAEKSYLVFELAIAGRYALAQEHIFRVEELDLGRAHSLGRFSVLPYRGGALSMLSLESDLHPHGAPAHRGPGPTLVVVIREREKLLRLSGPRHRRRGQPRHLLDRRSDHHALRGGTKHLESDGGQPGRLAGARQVLPRGSRRKSRFDKWTGALV